MTTTVTPTGASPLAVNPAVTAYVHMHHERGMIAHKVLPVIATPKAEFEYYKWSKADAFHVPELRLGRTGQARRMEFEAERVVDKTEHYGLSDAVAAEDVDAAMNLASSPTNVGDPIEVASLFLRRLLLLGLEVRVANAVFNSASYDNSMVQAVAAADRFSNDASDPWKLLQKAHDEMLSPPRAAVFGQDAWSAFRTHPSVLKAVNTTSGADAGMASREAVAAVLEVDEVLVGRSRIAMSREGQPLALKRAWGKSVAFISRPGARAGMGDDATNVASMREPGFGFIAQYQPLTVLTGFMQDRGIKGVHKITVRESCKEVISGGDGYGYLFTSVTA